MSEDCKTQFTLDELEGSARERALDTLRTWACEDEWWEYTYEDWHRGQLPALGIEVDTDSKGRPDFSFDLDRDSYMHISGSMHLTELVTIAPQLFAANLVLGAAVTSGCLTDYVGLRDSKVCDLEIDMWQDDQPVPELCNTPFAELPSQAFHDMLEAALPEFEGALQQYVSGAADAMQENLQDEYDYRTSDEALEEYAEANDRRWNEDGELL